MSGLRSRIPERVFEEFRGTSTSDCPDMAECFQRGLRLLADSAAKSSTLGQKPVTQVMPSWLALQKEILDPTWQFVRTDFLGNKLRQVRFPRSKKWRMQKKWRVDKRNFVCEPDDTVYVLASQKTIIAHPAILKKLIWVVNQREFDNGLKRSQARIQQVPLSEADRSGDVPGLPSAGHGKEAQDMVL